MAEKHSDKIPQYEINALARCLLPEIQKFFASPEGQKEFGGIVMIPPLLL